MEITTDNTRIVTDEFLQKVLYTSEQTRDHCTRLIEMIEAHPAPDFASLPAEVQGSLSAQQRLLYAHLSELRGHNRNAILKVRQSKHFTAEARQEVDRLHLSLQNLFYEERHLEGEIAACQSYDHKYQQLPLIPLSEFIKLHPEFDGTATTTSKTSSGTNDDSETEATKVQKYCEQEKALTIARINLEHEQRESLENRRQELLKKKQLLMMENKKRKEDLASLDQDLEKFIDAAKPIQKIFEKQY